ncbi:MAG: hypothetical protein Fur0025_42390 [Oscillatoriaceae cyanobacterium]
MPSSLIPLQPISANGVPLLIDSIVFDADYYRAANPDMAQLSDADAFTHFQTKGLDEGRRFSPILDLDYYRSHNPDLAGLSDRELFNHFTNFGIDENREFSPFFNLDFYASSLLEQNPNFLAENLNPNLPQNRQILQDFITRLNSADGIVLEAGGDPLLFSPYIDLQYYINNSPDLLQAGLSDKQLLQHLELLGLNEGRKFSLIFDPKYYIENNPDLARAGLSAQQLLEHYQLNGINESRRPSLLFDVEFYRDNNRDLQERGLTNPELIEHFIRTGLRVEGRQSSVYFDPTSIDALLINSTPATDPNQTDGETTATVPADNLLQSKVKWPTPINGTLTYSFVTEASAFLYEGTESSVGEVSEKVKNNVRKIMQEYNKILPFNLIEVPDRPPNTGQIRIMFSDGPSYAYAYEPGIGIGGDLHLSRDFENDPDQAFSAAPGSYGYETLIHEIGHALGLKHPNNYASPDLNATDTVGEDGPFLPFFKDNNTNTVMSYTFVAVGASTPMAYDIRALQFLYGFSEGNKGDNVYRFDGSNFIGVKQTIWDGGGNDTLDFSGLPITESYFFDMNEGGQNTARSALNGSTYISNTLVTDENGELVTDANGQLVVQANGPFAANSYTTVIGFGVTIENLIGSPVNDDILGNNKDNIINGGGGGDLIIGSKGNDTLTGGAGPDVFVLSPGDGTDIITDFTNEQDRIALGSTLTFEDIAILPSGANTIISIPATGEVLAVLAGVPQFAISRDDFVLV